MKRRAEWLWRACSALGLRVEFGYRLTLADGRELISVARIEDLGAPAGMLLFSNFNEIKDHISTLKALGYGFSITDEPRSNESFELATFEEMFRDWGWSGQLGKKPKWM